MKQKAIFLDLDGTLLNDAREITEGNRQAIRQALEAGHKVVIATGRPLVSALAQAKKLGLTEAGCYCIAFNGGMIYDMGAKSLIYREAVRPELVQAVFAEAGRRQVHLQAYDDTFVLVPPQHSDDYVNRYCSKVGMDYRVVSSVEEIGAGTCKMLGIDYVDRAPLQGLIDWVGANTNGELEAFFSCKEYIEIIPHGLGKGNAIRRLAGILGIPMEDTIAAGDEENDLTMIREAGLGCAMANAVPAVKAVADYITKRDNNQDGIQEIIEAFML